MKLVTLLIVAVVGIELVTSRPNIKDPKVLQQIQATQDLLADERKDIYGDGRLLPAVSKRIEIPSFTDQFRSFFGIETKTEETSTTAMPSTTTIGFKSHSTTQATGDYDEDTIATDIEIITTTARYSVWRRN